MISYKVTFRSEKVTNVDIESLFTARKDCAIGADIDHILEIMSSQGEGVIAINSILSAMNGYLNPVNSEMDRRKVIINICIPFHSGNKAVRTEMLHIAKNMVNETPLTSKWRPEPMIFRNHLVAEDNIIMDQISLVNAKSHAHKRTIINCGSIEIKPVAASGIKHSHEAVVDECDSESYSSSSDMEFIEHNDVNSKMKSYSGDNLVKFIKVGDEIKS